MPPPWPGLRRHRPDRRLALAWFDAHGDFNTPATTPSGNVWGMPFAMACGRGDATSSPRSTGRRSARTMRPCSAARSSTRPSRGCSRRRAWPTSGPACSRGPAGLAALARLGDGPSRTRVDGCYIAFDMDVLDAAAGWALTMPEPDGISLATAIAAVRILAAAMPVDGIGTTAILIRSGDARGGHRADDRRGRRPSSRPPSARGRRARRTALGRRECRSPRPGPPSSSRPMSGRRQPQPPPPSTMAGWVVLLSVVAIVVSLGGGRLHGPPRRWRRDGRRLPDARLGRAAGRLRPARRLDGHGRQLLRRRRRELARRAGRPPTVRPPTTAVPPGDLLRRRQPPGDDPLPPVRAGGRRRIDVPLIRLGDELFATEDPSNASTSVYVRRGGLVAVLVAPTSARSGRSRAGRPGGRHGPRDGGLDRGAGPPDDPSARRPVRPARIDLPTADVLGRARRHADAHVAPELEAMLPKAVAGVDADPPEHPRDDRPRGRTRPSQPKPLEPARRLGQARQDAGRPPDRGGV